MSETSIAKAKRQGVEDVVCRLSFREASRLRLLVVAHAKSLNRGANETFTAPSFVTRNSHYSSQVGL